MCAKACVVCGCKYESTGRNQKQCSDCRSKQSQNTCVDCGLEVDRWKRRCDGCRKVRQQKKKRDNYLANAKRCNVCNSPCWTTKRDTCNRCARKESQKRLAARRAWRTVRTCDICGNGFTPKMPVQEVCSAKECQEESKRRRARQRIETYRVAIDCECLWCKETFRPKTNDRTTYCSRKCAYDHKTHVSKTWTQRRDKRSMYASALSRGFTKWIAILRRTNRTKKSNKPRKTFTCRACCQTKTFVLDGHKPLCRQCKQRAIDAYAKYCNSYRRRLVAKKTPLELQAWDIFQAECFTCYLCDRKTNPDAEKNDPLYPTLDHVVPRARGGGHERSNLRCACRQCNNRKTDRTPIEYAEITAIPKGYHIATWLRDAAYPPY